MSGIKKKIDFFNKALFGLSDTKGLIESRGIAPVADKFETNAS